MSGMAGDFEGWLPLWLVGVSGFVLALLSAYLPRSLGVVLVALALFGTVAAASIVARRRESVGRALLPGIGPALGVGTASVLLDPDPVPSELPAHLGSGVGLAVCAVVVGFALGLLDVRRRDGASVPHQHDLIAVLALLLFGTVLVAATAPSAAQHVPRLVG